MDESIMYDKCHIPAPDAAVAQSVIVVRLTSSLNSDSTSVTLLGQEAQLATQHLSHFWDKKHS